MNTYISLHAHVCGYEICMLLMSCCYGYLCVVLQVWDIGGELQMQSTLMPLLACARSCALSPDGSLAVAGFDDGSLKVQEKNTVYLFIIYLLLHH